MNQNLRLGVLATTIAIMSSVGTACAGKDCPAIGYLDRVEVVLPAEVADDGLALRICVDGRCGGIGDTVQLTGRTLTMFVDPAATEQSAMDATVRLVDASASIDVTTKAKWRIDHHNGCATSRVVSVRYDPTTDKLQ